MFRSKNRVRIFSEDIDGMEHSVFIERVSDGVILGKYRAKEKITVDGKTKQVSGREAAALACKVNGWPVAA